MIFRITYVKTTVALVDRDSLEEAERDAQAILALKKDGLLKEWGEGVTVVIKHADEKDRERFEVTK